MARAGLTWTEERIERLKELWTEGLSASQIAAELGGDVSRNSVLGKANRLGLAHGPAKASSAPRPCKPPPPKPPLRIRGELTATVSRSATDAVESHGTRLISQ